MKGEKMKPGKKLFLKYIIFTILLFLIIFPTVALLDSRTIETYNWTQPSPSGYLLWGNVGRGVTYEWWNIYFRIEKYVHFSIWDGYQWDCQKITSFEFTWIGTGFFYNFNTTENKGAMTPDG